MTNAKWYGGQAAVPKLAIVSFTYFSKLSGLSSDLVFW